MIGGDGTERGEEVVAEEGQERGLTIIDTSVQSSSVFENNIGPISSIASTSLSSMSSETLLRASSSSLTSSPSPLSLASASSKTNGFA